MNGLGGGTGGGMGGGMELDPLHHFLANLLGIAFQSSLGQNNSGAQAGLPGMAGVGGPGAGVPGGGGGTGGTLGGTSVGGSTHL